jgi:hypothetical protein
MIDGSKRGLMQVKNVRNFLDSVLDEDIHTKRVASLANATLANATLGVMTGASLGVAVIGQSLAQARGLLPKHAVKQVDRLLSNPRIEAWDRGLGRLCQLGSGNGWSPHRHRGGNGLDRL